MAKTDAQRVTDTLTFLQNTNVVTPLERADAYQLAHDFVNAVYPVAGSPAYHQFSMSLSLGYYQGNDQNDRRKMARALFLLWKAMHHYDNGFTLPIQNIAQINQATAQRQLKNYIRKARCLYENLHGGIAGATHVLAKFTTNPLLFLRNNKVYVNGSGTLDQGQAPRNVLDCGFEYNPAFDRYEFWVGDLAWPQNGRVLIEVDSVTAFHWTDQRYVPRPIVNPQPLLAIGNTNFNQMTGIELSGIKKMVTTQFTGCAFCMAEHAGSMYCAHVSPAGVPNRQPDTNGPTLAAQIIATGAFANAGNTAPRVYGRTLGTAPNPQGYDLGMGGGVDTYMTIVGFPGGTSYRIYAQTTRANAIADVRQIF